MQITERPLWSPEFSQEVWSLGNLSKREQYMNERRRISRQQTLSKIRIFNQTPNESENLGNVPAESLRIMDSNFEKEIVEFHGRSYGKENILDYSSAIYRESLIDQLYGTIAINKLLRSPNPPIQQIIDLGLIPKLIENSRQNQKMQLKLESVEILVSITTGDIKQIYGAIVQGVIELFIDEIRNFCGIEEILVEVLWGLGNLAGECIRCRDKIINIGGIKELEKVFYDAMSENTKNNGKLKKVLDVSIWVLTRICRKQPILDFEVEKSIMRMFIFAIENNVVNDSIILRDICFNIAYFTDYKIDRIKFLQKVSIIVDSGILKKILDYAESSFETLVITCLKILSDVAFGNDNHKDYLIEIGIFDRVIAFLMRERSIFRREACWIIVHLVSNSGEHCMILLQNENVLNKLVEVQNEHEDYLNDLIMDIIGMLIKYGEKEVVHKFIANFNVLQNLDGVLKHSTKKSVLEASLRCIEEILIFGIEDEYQYLENELATELVFLGVIKRIEKLQFDEADSVYKKSYQILREYFYLRSPLLMKKKNDFV